MVSAKALERLTIGLAATVLAVLGTWSILAVQQIDNPPRAPDLTIGVVGRQFFWRFLYPDGSVKTVLEIPAGKLVRLELRSEDVIHSLYIPKLGLKMDVIPGRVNVMYLQVDEKGEYEIFCAEFCGVGHFGMITKMVVK